MVDQDDLFEQSRVLTIIRMVTAPISAIASSAIIYLVMSSSKKLTTTQNRLLVAISICDIVSSITMSLGPIPMPRDTPDMFLALGNTASCEAQAFTFIVGNIMASFINTALCIFFLLKVRYNVSDETIRSKVEPFFYLVPLVLVMVGSIYSLERGDFRPNSEINMCFAPGWKGQEQEPHKNWTFICGGVLMFIIVPMVIFTTMIVIYVTVLRQEQKMATYGRGSLTSITVTENSQSLFHVRVVMYRGLAYCSAWLATFLFPTVMFIGYMVSKNFKPNFPLKILLCTLHPLQGFFNFIIFMYPKVLCSWDTQPELSFFQAFSYAWKNVDDVRFTTRNQRRGAGRGGDPLVGNYGDGGGGARGGGRTNRSNVVLFGNLPRSNSDSDASTLNLSPSFTTPSRPIGKTCMNVDELPSNSPHVPADDIIIEEGQPAEFGGGDSDNDDADGAIIYIEVSTPSPLDDCI